eukprot:jgi/Psemu1/292742/fgenesh1_pg.1269_\
MRSFPGAFVFPGGNTDEGESLVEAVAREISEETGLAVDPDSWTLECLWESVYPTTIPPHDNLDDNDNDNDNDTEGAIRAHHLRRVALHTAIPMDEEITDGAVSQKKAKTTATTTIPLSDLAGIYPRAREPAVSRGAVDTGRECECDNEWCGMAQGSLFALEEFVAKRRETIFATNHRARMK